MTHRQFSAAKHRTMASFNKMADAEHFAGYLAKTATSGSNANRLLRYHWR